MKQKKILILCLIIALLILTACKTTYYTAPAYESYNDVYVPLASSKLAGVNDPDFVVFVNNSRAYSFANNPLATQDEVFFTFQMPHTYVLGSEFHSHIHYTPTTSGNGSAMFNLECAKADIGKVFYSYNTTEILTIPANNQTTHLLEDFPLSYTCQKVSCIMQCRLQRLSADGRDSYTGSVFVHAIDYHVLQHEYGTFTEYI